jgi:DNA repair protein RadC
MDNTHLGEPFHRWDPTKRHRMQDLPDADRPREKLLRRGAASLSDVELLAVLLGSGTRRTGVLDLASRILHALDGRLDRADTEQLQSIAGIGNAKACQIGAALELARRHIAKGRHVIHEAADALPYLQAIRGKRQEHFACISLNGANEVIESRIVTVGLLDTNQVHPREVFSDPIGDRAASVLVAHNHPSGTLEPSPQDLALTRRIVKAGDLLGIRVLDHLIITADGFLSLKEAGHL